MTILLVGAAGQVGRELRATLPALGHVVATTRDGSADAYGATHALDVADAAAVAALIESLRPRVVVNASAYTAVDRAESEPDLARLVNADAPAAMAQACARIGARLVHYSTDYVFDGQGTRPYREGDATSPLGVYGATKLAGEQAIAASGTDHLVLRTAWVYALHGHNFLRTMLRLGTERDELRVVDDQIGSPTPAWLIAQATTQLLAGADGLRGVVHVVASGSTSWRGFADAIFDEALAAGLIAQRPRVVPIPTSAYPTPARRPAWSVLGTSKLEDAGFTPLPWRDALAATLRQGIAAP